MNSYTKPSGNPQKIKVESHLIYVLWNCGIAYADTQAPFIVRTALVGEGAEIKAKLKTDSGKTLEKISGKMTANWFHGWMPVPKNVKMDNMLYLEVELPKHGLNGESNQIPAGPVIQPRSMKWSQKEVKRGDLVKMMAEFIDLPDPTSAVVRVYEYDQSGNHLPVVSIPTMINANKLELQWEFQYHDDTGQIPTQDELQPYNKKYQQPQYYFVVEIEGALIGTKQESGLMKFKDWVDHKVCENGAPLKNEKISIVLPDGSKKELTTDEQGTVQLKDIPPGSVTIDLVNDDQLRNDESELLKQFDTKGKNTATSSDPIKGKDESCDNGNFGPDPGSSVEGTSSMKSLDNTYDHEFLKEEQERPEE